MKEIPCKEYVVQVGHGLLPHAAAQIQKLLPKVSSYLVVSDTNVAPLYAQTLIAGFTARVELYVIPAGEASKCRRMKQSIEDFMLAKRFHRDSCVVALGGGVVGDLAGYVAATYMRGVAFIQIPTSLLACVDSSIGGKTGIDVEAGKNLIGAFHQPKRVIVDLSLLKTLPKRELVNGMAEIIKAGAIFSEPLFALLEANVDAILNLEKDVVLDMVAQSIAVKTTVVNLDVSEQGIRAILNFGHSIGHGIEAIMQPELLHGECVAIGMVKEAEIARGMGLCSSATVGRLLRCIKAFGLPVRVPARSPSQVVLEKMEVDKKNSGSLKKLVLLTAIGKVHSNPYTVAVEDSRILHVLEPQVTVHPSGPVNGSVSVPGSKSISNRVLLLAALGKGVCRITGLLHSDDTQVMMDVLQYLGVQFSWEDNGNVLVVTGTGGVFPKSIPNNWYLSNAGTAARFLTSVATYCGSDVTLTGNYRMQERPIADLVDALVANGCQITYGKTKGCPPLQIKATGLPGGTIRMAGKISSQYVSSVLLSAPYASKPLELVLEEDEPTSLPYILMTTDLMAKFGIPVKQTGLNKFSVPKGVYTNPSNFHVEVDASSATYPLAFAAITGGRVTVPGLGNGSTQGDAAVHTILRDMGCTTSQDATSTTVQGPKRGSLKAVEVDMQSMTDAFMTIAVVAAAANGTTKITGIANQRVKECNRIEVMVHELTKCGVVCGELPDGIWIQGKGLDTPFFPRMYINVNPSNKFLETPAKIACHNDHRIAMSFAVLSAYWPNIVISDKECTDKTFPSFWDECANSMKLQLSSPLSTSPQSSGDIPSVLFVIGMRGAGKTSLGRHAASALGYNWIDMDHYLEKDVFGITVKEFVAKNGWEAFRAAEAKCVKQWIIAASSRALTKTIISCGGGVVESPEAVTLLQAYPLVVHVKRDIRDVLAYLAKDTERPAYGEEIEAVWTRRAPLFTAASSYLFTVSHQDMDFNRINRDFVRFLSVVLRQYDVKKLTNLPDSYFLSLTFPDLKELTPTQLATVASDVQALELRVDLLKSHDKDFVADQVARLRSLSTLPIIYTVRSWNQGGAFPDTPEPIFDLLHFGLTLGCEIIDMECCWDSSLQSSLLQAKGGAAILASYHAIQSRSTKEKTTGTMLFVWLISNPKHVELFELCAWQGQVDICKVVLKAYDVSDAYMIHQVLSECQQRWAFKMPCIAVCTTTVGSLSRVLNRTLTPVTHPSLPVAAAPGQLSVAEIVSLRKILGMPAANNTQLSTFGKSFYLFGSPITHSPSPAMHNAAFQHRQLPYRYDLCETTDLSLCKKTIRADNFGGASVTIPMKLEIIPLMDVLSPAAQAIGSVNTIVPQPDGKLLGENTDWIGIYRPIQRRLGTSDRPRNGLVIGAGGTSMSACYGMQQLGLKVYVYNRTLSKAQEVAARFNATALSSFDSSTPKFDVVMGTVPSTAGFTLPESVLHPQLIVMDAAYKPAITPLLQQALIHGCQCIQGYEMLVEQGLEQSKLWTGDYVPKHIMETQVKAGMLPTEFLS
ncbi:pentafunctional AROM polypeptide [Thraustotheca clavata]|uniref:Pentafunctional AROM polypeptide n=1 Tax=Thraustotheca clavata TaxID=74557 RepID=A0A1V9ZIZ1_9STRA|nr:pentafunctional AROM polypeptide [Thraustotheca clavata]